MEKRKAICYANLNCKNASRDVTDEQMELYFKRFCLHTNVEPVQFVIDRYDESTYKSKRTGWNHVLDVCKEGTVELILVPTYLMVCSAFIDTLEEIRELKSKYNVPFYFIRERLYTEEENFETTFQLHMMVQDHTQYCKKNVLEMRSEFFEATGCKAEDASAIKVQIDDMLYEKSCIVSKDYGMTVEELIECLLAFATDQAKREELELLLSLGD